MRSSRESKQTYKETLPNSFYEASKPSESQQEDY